MIGLLILLLGVTDIGSVQQGKGSTDGGSWHVIVDSAPAGGSGVSNTELRATPLSVTFDAGSSSAIVFPGAPFPVWQDAGSEMTVLPKSGAVFPTYLDAGTGAQVTVFQSPTPWIITPHYIYTYNDGGYQIVTFDAGTEVTTLPKSGSTWPVSGPLTDSQLRATPLSVTFDAGSSSATVFPGAPFTIMQDAGTEVTVLPKGGGMAVFFDAGSRVTIEPGTGPIAVVIDAGNTITSLQGGVWSINQDAGTTITTYPGGGTIWVTYLDGGIGSQVTALQSGRWDMNVDAGSTLTVFQGGRWDMNVDAGQKITVIPDGTLPNPCINESASIQSLAAATSGTAAVQIIGLSGSTKIYICSLNVTGISGTTPTIAFKYGTGTACATGGVSIVGPWTFAANTMYNFTGPTFYITPAGQEFCYIQTGTSPVANYAVTYVQQ